MQNNLLSLFELNNRIKDVIHENLGASFWVKAEISDVRENSNGHCYLELIEKAKDSENIIARSRANIWASTYRLLKPYFETSTGRKLEQGIKILVNASVDFHELYGISLNIKDIEPSYTLGDLELQRMQVIKRLTSEGVIDMNKQLDLPPVPQRIAVISSKTAAGFEDFINQLDNNKYHYKYYYKLFEASMQGLNAEESIIDALDKINQSVSIFDIVVLIRGGGSKSDLSCFDSYWLSFNIAQFPLPVITGIGHERDNCVVDLVAHSRQKTPTAVAEFIVSRTNEFENKTDQVLGYLVETFNDYITKRKADIDTLSYQIIPQIKQFVNKFMINLLTIENSIEMHTREKFQAGKQLIETMNNSILAKIKLNSVHRANKLEQLEKSIRDSSSQSINDHLHKTELYASAINLINPDNILQRGYSITYSKGLVLKKGVKLNLGDQVTTKLIDRILESKITDIKIKNDEL